MSLATTQIPESLCLLRLSALGDVSHVVPLVRTLQAYWPNTRLTWLIGKLEHKLIGDLPGVEFLIFDKAQGWRAYRALRAQLKKRRFDALLHMQVALRANLLSTLVRAPLRVGYDRARSKDGHGLFINRRIPERSGEHVLDAIASFLEPLGLRQTQARWDIPIPAEARFFAEQHLPGTQPTLLISPCSSHSARNWRPEHYASIANYATQKFRMRSVLCGGPSHFEREFGDAVLSHITTPIVDLIGKDTLKQLLAVLQKSTLLLAPDSGPMHLANAVGTPVLGLHAASNPARSGPYSNRRWCVDRYAAAAQKFRGQSVEQLPWGTKLEYPGVMDLIEVAAVIERLDEFALEHGIRPTIKTPANG